MFKIISSIISVFFQVKHDRTENYSILKSIAKEMRRFRKYNYRQHHSQFFIKHLPPIILPKKRQCSDFISRRFKYDIVI